MRIRYVSGTLGMFFTLFSNAQVVSDTIKSVDLSEVVVTGSYRHAQEKKTTLTLELFQKDYLNRHFTGNLVQTLKNVPGVHSMDIGAGFSKPMIRGLGFNRIAVSENGIKQEGQQWGADHGLEIDAFNVDEVRILKGPSFSEQHWRRLSCTGRYHCYILQLVPVYGRKLKTPLGSSAMFLSWRL